MGGAIDAYRGRNHSGWRGPWRDTGPRHGVGARGAVDVEGLVPNQGFLKVTLRAQTNLTVNTFLLLDGEAYHLPLRARVEKKLVLLKISKLLPAVALPPAARCAAQPPAAQTYRIDRRQDQCRRVWPSRPGRVNSRSGGIRAGLSNDAAGS
jgi:hypothetical protein